MAAGPLFAVLATRALDASKAARAAERQAPRAPKTPAREVATTPRSSPERQHAPGPERLRRRILAHLTATARPRP